MNKILTAIAALAAGMLANAESIQFTMLPVTVDEGGTATLTVCMENDFDVRDWQCFLNLPEGITPELNAKGRPAVAWCGREDDHVMGSNFINGQCRVAAYSATAGIFPPGDGPLFTVPVVVDVPIGTYEVTLVEGEGSTNTAKPIVSPEYTGIISVVKTTGIDAIIDLESVDAEAEYYDLTGRRVYNPAPGIYLMRQNGEVSKVAIK